MAQFSCHILAIASKCMKVGGVWTLGLLYQAVLSVGQKSKLKAVRVEHKGRSMKTVQQEDSDDSRRYVSYTTVHT
jgi:hypothetical protein